MNRVKEVQRINAKDLQVQLKADTVGNAGKWDVSKSWHAQYKDSAYVYVGGLPYDLSEGDIMVVFSQFGEVVDVNLPRDKETGKPRGFAFIAYEDQRSTVLAVDNFNGAKVLGRTLRCDHCADFKEEQKKDPDAIPDHVARKLSEQQLLEKREQIERCALAAPRVPEMSLAYAPENSRAAISRARPMVSPSERRASLRSEPLRASRSRNVELDRDNAAKAELFADGRGTAETEAQRAEREIRREMADDKDAKANARRLSHIEAVRARRGHEASAVLADEKRRHAQWEERKRERDTEMEQAERKRADRASVDPDDSRGSKARPAGGKQAVGYSEAKWARLMGGKAARKPKGASASGARAAGELGPAEPREKKKVGEDSISVDETNSIRASLGLAPLRK